MQGVAVSALPLHPPPPGVSVSQSVSQSVLDGEEEAVGLLCISPIYYSLDSLD